MKSKTRTALIPQRSGSLVRPPGPTLTVGTALLLLIALEVRSPYYFLTDDNVEEHLPAWLHNARGLLAGQLPLYNFHTWGGVPHASLAQPAVFYFPPYLALLLSTLVWRHPFAAVDLLSITHGLIAVAGGYFLLRHFDVTPTAAAFGGLTALSAVFVWWGQMWIAVTMLCAWFPWMAWAALRFLDRPNPGRAAALILFRLALLYGGYPQFFVLGMIFEHLFALGYCGIGKSSGWFLRLAYYVSLMLPTALLGLSFLLPVGVEVARSLERSGPLRYAEFSSLAMPPIFWLFGQLFVFVQVGIPRDNIFHSLPYLSHVGYIPTALSLGTFSLSKKQRSSQPLVLACAICFVLALLWSWNTLGPVIFHIPVLNRFRWPFKLVFFAGFFQCLLAAFVLSRLDGRWQRVAVAGFVLNWLLVFCVLPDQAWHICKYHPPLSSPWHERIENGRYLLINDLSARTESTELVGFNYAELWGFDNLLGYEPLLSASGARVAFRRTVDHPDLRTGAYEGPADQWLINHIRRWSVRYVLVSEHRADASTLLANAGFQKRAFERGWTLWEDPTALPRLHWADVAPGSDFDEGVKWVPHTNSIDVFFSRWPGRRLIMAFTANPGLQTCVEKKASLDRPEDECSPVAATSDGLIQLDVPHGTRHIRLVCRNRLLLFSGLIALATAIALALILVRSHHQENNKVDERYTSATSVRAYPERFG
jgi:hypothetical protein